MQVNNETFLRENLRLPQNNEQHTSSFEGSLDTK